MTSDRSELFIDYSAYKVLFVDDERANLETALYSLEGDFSVEIATGGHEAVDKLRDHEIAVMVCDQRMPRMSGVEVCAAARHVSPHTVRMIVTAYADVGVVVRAINEGAVSRYLTKPYHHEQLVGALREGIQTFSEGADLRQVSHSLLHDGPRLVTRAVEAEIAHDFRNMLTPLQVVLQDMQHQVNEVSDSQERPSRDFLARLVEDLDDVSQSLVVIHAFVERLQAGAGKLGRGRAELGRLVDATVRMFEPRLRPAARVVVDVREDAVVPLDPAGVTQIFMNLLVNAILAVEEREGAGWIEITVDREGEMARLVVRDDGPGIPDDVLPRIFDSRFTTRATGTGRGLAIARRLVREAGGTIEARNRSGAGAELTVRFPPAQPDPPTEIDESAD